ncbi:MAG: adenylate kinase [Renibacterium sp.]|nr:adenylate kinase [Renibacterium sp.]
MTRPVHPVPGPGLAGGAHRVLVYGVTGSGKSALAESLSAATGIKAHLVDDEFGWLPGWTPRSPEEIRTMVEPVVAEESWIFDSAYGSFRDLVLARAQLIIGLDYSRPRSLVRLLRRTFRRIVHKELVCNGNQETWLRTLSKDSIVPWHFRSFKRKQAVMHELAAAAARDPSAPRVLLFKNPAQTARWLRSFAPGPAV